MKKKETVEETTRLNKFISHNSKYSRREADRLIEEGKVKVNGDVVDNLATQVTANDEVYINKSRVKEDKDKIVTVIVYNKPKGEIVSKKDPQGRKTIYDTLDAKYKHFLSAGRLDYASEGLLLLSDSVDVIDALTHSKLERVYKIKVNGEITKHVEAAMQNGLELQDASDGAYKNSKIKSMRFSPFSGYNILTNTDKFSKIKVAITEGKNRELRRFFAHFGLDVLDLKRLDFGGISLNNLPTGKSRFLTREEYRNLKFFMNEDD